MSIALSPVQPSGRDARTLALTELQLDYPTAKNAVSVMRAARTETMDRIAAVAQRSGEHDGTGVGRLLSKDWVRVGVPLAVGAATALLGAHFFWPDAASYPFPGHNDVYRGVCKVVTYYGYEGQYALGRECTSKLFDSFVVAGSLLIAGAAAAALSAFGLDRVRQSRIKNNVSRPVTKADVSTALQPLFASVIADGSAKSIGIWQGIKAAANALKRLKAQGDGHDYLTSFAARAEYVKGDTVLMNKLTNLIDAAAAFSTGPLTAQIVQELEVAIGALPPGVEALVAPELYDELFTANRVAKTKGNLEAFQQVQELEEYLRLSASEARSRLG